MELKKIRLFIFALFLQIFPVTLSSVYAENLVTSQVQRSSEITKEEEEIRGKIEKGDRVFIQEISISGYSVIIEDVLEETIAPYRNKWLGLSDILQIIDRIKKLYSSQNAISVDITYQVIDSELIMHIKEKTPHNTH